MAERGCPACANAQLAALNTHSDGLERLREAAAKRGGRCLVDGYGGIDGDYEWECAEGHQWFARGYSVVRGNWCQTCFGLRHSDRLIDPDGLVLLQTAATERGGHCLNNQYDGTQRSYRFRCAAGHEWKASGGSVLRGSWCPRCARQSQGEANRVSDGLAQLRAVAESHGGQLVDCDYVGIAAYYTFRCSQGHEWQTRGERVLEGGWCRSCVGVRRRITLGILQHIARSRGGRCLSTEYRGVKLKLAWECGRSHVWEATPDSIIHSQSWCPNCSILDRTKKQHLRLRYDCEGKD